MSEDEAAELLLTQRAHWRHGLGWRIVKESTAYGDTILPASAEDSAVFYKVMATINGPKREGP